MSVLQKASVWLSQFTGLTPGRQDGNNLVTNKVTSLQEYEDDLSSGSSGVLCLSAAWACVNLLAGTQASLPLMVFKTSPDGRRSIAYDHPLYRILHDSPNADQTALDYWEFMTACLEMQGNAFSEIERSGDRLIALDVPIPPEMVTVRRTNSGALEYNIQGRSSALPQERMLHIRGFGGSPLGGLSTLSFGRKAFGLAGHINATASATFRNGMRPGVVLESDKAFTVDQRLVAEELLDKKYQGAMNAGRPFLADNGLKVKAISLPPDDAQMLESRAFSIAEVCRFFGVPPHMIGHTEKNTSWGTGIEQQTLGFLKFTLRRRLKRIEQALEKQLLAPADRAVGVTIEFNIEGLLRADSKARSEYYRTMTSIGAMTINEVRAYENEPPVEGGDVPRMQAQNVPITEAPGLTPQPDALEA